MTGARVLLVEDDADHIDLARRVFEKCGMAHEVQVVEDGADALDYLFGRARYAGQNPAASLKLVLLDLKLPKVSGLDILRQLKTDARLQRLPVIVVSASKEEPDLLQSFNMGISD